MHAKASTSKTHCMYTLKGQNKQITAAGAYVINGYYNRIVYEEK